MKRAEPLRPPRRRDLLRAAALGGLAPLSGCGLLAPPAPPPRRGLLTQLPDEVPRREGSAGAGGARVLLVAAPQAHRAFDTTQMAYTLRPHAIDHYRDHEWAATPPQMLQPLLVATLQRTQGFAAVLSGSAHGARATDVLQVRIDALVQDFTATVAQARLALQVQLVRRVPAVPEGEGDARRAASREVVVSVPMAQRAPEAGIVAANAATAQALREVAAFVLAQTGRD